MSAPDSSGVAAPAAGSRAAPVSLPLARQRWLALALLCVLAFAFQGSRGLYEPDEGRYSDVALQMLDSGDVLVPHLDPEHPHYTKPPLAYWAIGAGIALLGRDEWGVRLPSALAFVATGLLVFGIARRLGSPSPLRATGVWATMLLPVGGFALATTDPLLTAFGALAGLGAVAIATGDAARGRWLLWIALGLAFGTKGPPGLLPLAGFVVHGAATARWRGVRALFATGPVLAFAVLAFAWFAWIVARDPAMLRYFLVFETVDRVASDVHHRNPGWLGLLKVYGATVAVGALPWLPLAAWAARRGGSAPGASDTAHALSRDPRVASGGIAHRDADRLLLAWLLVPFAIFCAAQSRLPLYLLPSTVPLALWISGRFDAAGDWRRPAWVAFVAWAGLLVVLKGVAANWHAPQDSRAFARELAAAVDVAAFDEFVFVDAPARYGLALYLGRRVEAGTLQPQPRRVVGIEPRHGLCEEIAERERALLLVRERDAAAFDAVRATCPAPALVNVGRVRDWRLYAERP